MSALIDAHGYTLIHPYDNPHVVAGQGTAGLEMLRSVPDLDMLVVPIGGGGLIAGMALIAKSIKPEIQIIGVEAELYPSVSQMIAGQPVICGGETIAEGIAVKSPGSITLPIIARPMESQVRRPIIRGQPMVSAFTRFKSPGRCQIRPVPSPITRLRAIATTHTISNSLLPVSLLPEFSIFCPYTAIGADMDGAAS